MCLGLNFAYMQAKYFTWHFLDRFGVAPNYRPAWNHVADSLSADSLSADGFDVARSGCRRVAALHRVADCT
jgi:hypothetical protein